MLDFDTVLHKVLRGHSTRDLHAELHQLGDVAVRVVERVRKKHGPLSLPGLSFRKDGGLTAKSERLLRGAIERWLAPVLLLSETGPEETVLDGIMADLTKGKYTTFESVIEVSAEVVVHHALKVPVPDMFHWRREDPEPRQARPVEVDVRSMANVVYEWLERESIPRELLVELLSTAVRRGARNGDTLVLLREIESALNEYEDA